jgi:hypothetical protein
MSFILSDGWKISAIIKYLIKKIPGCMTYVVQPVSGHEVKPNKIVKIVL